MNPTIPKSRAAHYLQKHKLLISQYGMSLSVARDILYNNKNILKTKYRTPAVLANCFILEYPAQLFRLRLQANGCIIIDGIPYTVEYQNCTPASIARNNTNVSASFRRFLDDFGLPAVVIVSPSTKYPKSGADSIPPFPQF